MLPNAPTTNQRTDFRALGERASPREDNWRQGSRGECGWCKKRGYRGAGSHVENDCWRKNGYNQPPAGWQNGGGGKKSQNKAGNHPTKKDKKGDGKKGGGKGNNPQRTGGGGWQRWS